MVAQIAVSVEHGHTASQDGTNYADLLRSRSTMSQGNIPSSIVSSAEACFPGASREGATKAKSSGASREGAIATKPKPFLAFPSDQRFKLSDLDCSGVTTMRRVRTSTVTLMAFFRRFELFFSLLYLANPADIFTKTLSLEFFRIVRGRSIYGEMSKLLYSYYLN